MLARSVAADAERAGITPAQALTDLEARTLPPVGSVNNAPVPLALTGSQGVNEAIGKAAEANPRVREIARQLADNAEQGVSGRLVGEIDRVTGGPQAYTAREAALRTQRANDAAAAYTQLYAQAGHLDARHLDWSRPAMTDARVMANRWLRDAGEAPITDTSRITPRQADYMGRALQDATDTAFRAGSNNAGHMAAGMRDAWHQAADAIPGYTATRTTYATQSSGLRALEAGRDLPIKEGQAADEARAAIAAMPPADLALAQQGVLQGLRDQFAGSPHGANLAARMTASSRAQRLSELLQQPTGPMSPQAFGISGVGQRLETEALAARNAQMLRQALPPSLSAAERLGDATSGMAAMAGLANGYVTPGRIDKALNFIGTDMNPARARIIADLTSGDPSAAIARLRAMPAGERRTIMRIIALQAAQESASESVAGQ